MTNTSTIEKSKELSIEHLVTAKREFISIAKGRLKVHPQVQSSLIPHHWKRIRDNWNGFSCGVLIVVRRPNGELLIIDGQHRYRAAMDIPTVNSLMCLVLSNINEDQEAKLWRDFNIVRKTKSAIDKFHIDVLIGVPDAVAIQNIVNSSGRIIPRTKTSDKTTVTCVATLRDIYRQYPKELREVFPMITKLCEGNLFDESIVRGITYIEAKMDGSLLEPVWTKRLLDVGYDKIKAEMFKIQRSSPRRMKPQAEIILFVMNYGRHKRLIVEGINDPEV